MSRGKVVWKFCVWPLCLCLLWGLLCLPCPVGAAQGTVTVDSWAALKAALETGTAPHIVVSGTNLKADSTIWVGRKVAVSAAEGAGPIARADNFRKTLIRVQTGGDLTLTNITLDGNGEKVQSTEPLISVSGKFTLGSGGKLCNNACDAYGSAVNVKPQGSFTMTGGQIYSNTTNAYGGGVYAAGEFIMTGGDVSSNRAYVGGGVYQVGETFTLKGGRIQNNLAINGGGVLVTGARFNLEGGTISGNQAPNAVGAGVYVDNSTGGAITVQGKPQLGLHDGDNGLYLALGMTVSIGPGGLAEGGRINLERPFDVADARVVAVKEAGTAASQEAARFHCQFDGYTVHPEAAGSPNYVLRAPRTVTVRAEDHGTITPAGDVQMPYGGSQSFTLSPESGYVVDKVLLDGKRVTPEGNAYTLENVTGNHTLSVSFRPEFCTVTVSAGDHGTITPAGDVQVPYGGSQSFALSPESGFVVDKVLLDGKPVAHTGGGVTLSGVTADHILSVSFTRGIVVPANEADARKKEPAPKEPDGTAEPERLGWYLATTALNVRTGPGTNYPKLGKLAAGERVEVLDVTDGWAKIAYAGGVDGYAYVSAQYLLPLSGGAQGDCTVLARTLNVRAGAGTDYAIVGQLRRGQTAQVLETVAGGAWLRIRYADGADGTAYISAKYAAH